MVFHRFLLRMYNTMVKRNDPKTSRYIIVYFWSLCTLYIGSQAFETAAVCYKWELVLQDSIWDEIFRIKALCIITIMFICNTFVSIKVLPILEKQINSASVTYFAIFMCAIFEVIILYREYIVAAQDNLKEHEPTRFKRVFITYFCFCEIILYIGLIGEIVH